MVEHRFGGIQTDIKLGVLREYMHFFTTALKKQNFELWYIDGFAGTGHRLVEHIIRQDAPLFGHSQEKEKVQVPGSARIALENDPPFDRLFFIEKHGPRYRALRAFCDRHPDRKISLLRGEANQELTRLCKETKWRGPGVPGRGRRAVLFLDPYGMSVDFNTTLKAISETEAVDVWYLFSLSGLYRQAARSHIKLTEKKKAAITRILGTDEWQDRFYPPPDDLFGGATDIYRSAEVDAIEIYVKERLETIFAKVLKPARLYNKQRVPMFSLFFAMANPDPPALGLATRGANYILKAGISSQVRPRK